jgi:pilus assembly protein CpaE
MVQYSDSLYVLSSEEELAEEMPRDPQALGALAGELRSKFHYLIADIPKSLINEAHAIIKESTHTVIVTDFSLVGMRDTLRLTQSIANQNAASQIIIVANRVGEYRQGEIARREFEKAIGRQISLAVPFQAKGVHSAMNMGSPAAGANRAIEAALDNLIDLISGTTGSSKPGLLQRLWQA